MTDIFHFKKFQINQSGCAMKVNTDGVLLAALANPINTKRILDIGTGTGLIALMLAQRFEKAIIDAVEIEESAASRAKTNFEESPYSARLHVFHNSIEHYFSSSDETYDLIISNPPFFINSLKSENVKKEQARHTNKDFFSDLLNQSFIKLKPEGFLILILPLETASLIDDLLISIPNLYLNELIMIHSFADSIPHRKILKIGFNSTELNLKDFVIYESRGIYSSEYQNLLKDFLTIF